MSHLWHIRPNALQAQLVRCQELQDQRYALPALSTALDGSPTVGAILVTHYAAIAPDAKKNRKCLQALPEAAFAEDDPLSSVRLTGLERAEMRGECANSHPLPQNWHANGGPPGQAAAATKLPR